MIARDPLIVKLLEHGVEVYIVGGAVRDTLMGRPVSDLDFVVVGSSAANMLAAGFQQVGQDFPVFLHPHTGDEFALARTERKTGVGHTGFTVHADANVTLADDLMRRDLTINAMAVPVCKWEAVVACPWSERNQQWHIIDPYDGRGDLLRGAIRPVQANTFVEDPLRLVRAARFAAVYNMQWDDSMHEVATIIQQSGELLHITPERYSIEIEKVIEKCTACAQVATFSTLLHQYGVFDHSPVNSAFTFSGKCPDSRMAMLGTMFPNGCNSQLQKRFSISNDTVAQINMVYLITQASTELTAETAFTIATLMKRAPACANWNVVHQQLGQYDRLCNTVAQLDIMMKAFDEVTASSIDLESLPPKDRSVALKQARIEEFKRRING